MQQKHGDLAMANITAGVNNADTGQMSRQSSVDPTNGVVAIETQSLDAPDDVEMRDAGDEASEPVNDDVDEHNAGKCSCLSD